MANMMFDVADIINPGEKAFFSACKEYADNSITVYHNRDVNGLEFDYLLLIPGIGLCVVEVKGWKPGTVSRVAPTGKIELVLSDGSVVTQDPRNQARSYQFAVSNTLFHYTGRRPLVFYIVCYPFLNKDFLTAKRFDANCTFAQTMCADDMVSKEAFNACLSNAIQQVNHHIAIDTFDQDLLDQTREIFEPGYVPDHDNSTGNNTENTRRQDIPISRPYSILRIIKADDDNRIGHLQELVDAYAHGTKVFAVFGSIDIQRAAAELLTSCLSEKMLTCDGSNLKIGSGVNIIPKKLIMIFNWSSFVIDNGALAKFPSDMKIVNGELSEKTMKVPELLDTLNVLNAGQYAIEHAPIQKNILVRAGAGTGKTAVMIDRISNLMYQHRWTPAELADRVTMITFTNEAADNMKRRLKARLQNLYLLTGDGDYLEMVSEIDHMQISTIHSYAKKLISKLGTAAGYGRDISIQSGRYNRQKHVEAALEKYIEARKSDPHYLGTLGLPIYELREKLLDFISSLENKSIDLTDIGLEQFGHCDDNKALHDLIISVVHEAETEYAKELKDNNCVYLGRLMPILTQLITLSPERLQEGLLPAARYMFIDEFQDTDDVQIGLLQKLAAALGENLFVVGDIKQCIYRFRGAEELAFDKLPKAEQDASWLPPFFLKHNYRTDNELLIAFEEYFSKWGYDGKRILPFRSGEDSLDNPAKSNGGLPIHDFMKQYIAPNENERMSKLFEDVNARYNNIRQQLNSGKALSDTEKTIAILVRENWQVREIVQYAKEHEHQLIIETQNGGDLFKSIPALELVVLLHALTHTGPEYLSRFIASNFIGTTLNKMKAYKVGRPNLLRFDKAAQIAYLEATVNEALSKTSGNIPNPYASLDAIRMDLRNKPVLQVLHRIYEQTKPWISFGQGNESKTEYYRLNVDKLLEMLIECSGQDGMTINVLTQYLENCVYSGRDEAARYPTVTQHDIRILCMTVHKSKGLEFGHVVLPYASFNTKKLKQTGMEIVAMADGHIGYNFAYGDGNNLHNDYFDRSTEEDEHLSEETRILYVAMTRAQHSFSWICLNKPTKDSWQSLLMKEGAI